MCPNEIRDNLKLRVAVVGLGGVGGYLAASLAKASLDIVGFARGEHLKQIKKNGLTIVEDEVSWTQAIDARDLSEVDSSFDLVIFCVKSYDLEESYRAIQNSCSSKTIMFSLSNGVSNGDVLRGLSDSIVLDACVYILSHREEAGVIRKKGQVFALVFGGDDEATAKVKEVFEKTTLRLKTPNDIKQAIWKKYIFISAFATLTSYYDKSIGYVYEHHKQEAKAVLEEIASVALCLDIDIDAEVQKALETARKIPYDSSTSMHLDFTNNRRDELKSLSGYIVNKGEEFTLELPYMKSMYEELLKRHID